MFKFPMYGVRKFRSKYVEGNYVILETEWTRWVLDYVESNEPSYWKRRLLLATDPFIPYRVYPLQKLYTQVSQIVHSKTKLFITCEGKLYKYKPKKFYKVVYEPIVASWKSRVSDRWAFRTLRCPTTFIAEKNLGYTHVGYIQVGRHFILYEFAFEQKPTIRKKL